MNDLAIIENGTVVVDKEGRIHWVGPTAEEPSEFKDAQFEMDVDMQGKGCVLPGFVDGHTHPVWAGDRVHEFEMKIGGTVPSPSSHDDPAHELQFMHGI